MTKKKNNIFTVEGTIYAKPTRVVKSKKDDKEYEFKSIILEIKREFKGKTYIELPEFQLGIGVIDSGFDIGDYVEIVFSLAGKRIGEWHKTEVKALYIKHPSIDGNDTRDVGGEVFKPKKDEVFVPPNPADDDDDNDLPF